MSLPPTPKKRAGGAARSVPLLVSLRCDPFAALPSLPPVTVKPRLVVTEPRLSAVEEVIEFCLSFSNVERGELFKMMLGALSSEEKVASVGDSFKSCVFTDVQK